MVPFVGPPCMWFPTQKEDTGLYIALSLFIARIS